MSMVKDYLLNENINGRTPVNTGGYPITTTQSYSTYTTTCRSTLTILMVTGSRFNHVRMTGIKQRRRR